MNKAQKQKRILLIILVLLMLVLLTLTFGLAYAKFIRTGNGVVIASTAEIICEMQVESSSEDQTLDQATIVNPYCTITIKNYEGQTSATATKVTQANVNYTVQVTPKENDFILPDYYWQNVQTGQITHTANLEGTLTRGQAQEQQYRIVFINSGETNLQKHVDFELIAQQAQ